MVAVKKSFLFFLFLIILSTIRCFYAEDNVLNVILSFAYLSFAIIYPGISIYLFFTSGDKKNCIGLLCVFVLIFGSVWNSFIILVLACLFKFTLSTLLIINSLFAIWIFLNPPKKIRLRATDKLDYFALVFIIIAVLLFFRPIPRVNGGRDPGVYFGTAMNIAKKGTLIFAEKSISVFPQKYYKENLLYNYEDSEKTGMYLPGFYIIDHQQGKIAPQFFHLYSSFIALLFALLGMKPALYSTCFLALLSVLALYYLLKSVFGEKTALLSIIIFIFSVHNVWYARYLNSEIIVQLLFFCSMLMFARSYKFREYVLAGLLLGLTFFARIDSMLFAGPIMAAGLLVAVNPKLIKSLGVTVITATVCFLTAQVYGYYFSKTYYLSKFLYFAKQNQHILFMFAAGYLCLWFFLYAMNKKISFRYFITAMHTLFCVGILLIFTTIYFTNKNSPAQWFMLYYPFYGLIMGFMGISLFFANTKKHSDNKIIVKIFLSATVFVWVTLLFPDPKIRPDHFWAIRRFTATVLPVVTIGMGYFFDFIFFKLFRRLKIVGIIFYISVICILFRILYPTIKLSECDGLIDGLYALKPHIAPGSAIIVFDPKIGLYGTPVYFSNILEHSLFMPVGQSANLMKNFETLEKILYGFIKNKRNVYFLSFKPQEFPLKHLTAKKAVRVKTPIPLLEIVINRLPSKTEPIFEIKENFLYVWVVEKK